MTPCLCIELHDRNNCHLGALATLAGVTLKGNFPSVYVANYNCADRLLSVSSSPVRIYTFGQPRTGNPTFATWVNSQIGVNNIFRGMFLTNFLPMNCVLITTVCTVVHTTDG